MSILTQLRSRIDSHFKHIARQEAISVSKELFRDRLSENLDLGRVLEVLNSMPTAVLDIKNLGYELGLRLKKELDETRPCYSGGNPPEPVIISSRATTQRDMESDWVAYWCDRMKVERIYHRKIWELCYVAQVFHQAVNFQNAPKGIGFGCGEEPLPSLFAASGASIMVTDLAPDEVVNRGWVETGQHASTLQKTWKSEIVAEAIFNERVSLEFVDMNAIPASLDGQFDFCWSICALEHLGSIQHGLDFIVNSMNVLKPGGVAVHTTEFNYTNEAKTLESGPTVLFQRAHFEEVAARLRDQGYEVAPLNFDVGNQPLDRFIDLPPYQVGEGWITKGQWKDINMNAHLRLVLAGIPSTCFAVIVRKPL